MSTLVFHHGALGDSVLIWPLLRALGSATLVGPLSKAKLAAMWLEGIEALDADAPDHTRLFVPQAPVECSDGWRERLAAADAIIGFISSGEDAWADNIRTMAPQAVHAFIRPRPGDDDPPVHITELHARQLRDAGRTLTPADPPPRTNHDGPVVIHPGSGGRAKRWPLKRFIAVIEHLAAMGRPTTVVLGEVERDTWSAEDLRALETLAEVVWPGTLIDLSRLIVGASVYLGNDSGPTHLAAQLGVPTIALFGPTDPRVWSPVGPMVRVFAPPSPTGMRWLPPGPVIEAIARLG